MSVCIFYSIHQQLTKDVDLCRLSTNHTSIITNNNNFNYYWIFETCVEEVLSATTFRGLSR